MNFETFIKQAWKDHAKDASGVANRLSEGTELIENEEQIPELARLATHIWGEHLGRWKDGVEFLEGIRNHSTFKEGSESDLALVRSIAILRLASGEEAAIEKSSRSNQIWILSAAASALAQQGQIAKAQYYLRQAMEKAQLGLSKDDPACRALAVSGNSLACALEEKTSRTSAEMDLMVLAAEAARKYWEIAGTWLEVERAEYRLAMSHLKAGNMQQALEHAQTCLEMVKENEAPAMEHFFALEALAIVEKSRGNQIGYGKALELAKEQYAKLESENERTWCRESLVALER
jgi:tetratricopeptide (TPR) repeat protein